MSTLFIDGSKLLYHLDRVRDWKAGENIFPIHVEISPTSACNHRCTLCCVDYKGHKPMYLSREVLLNLIDDFSEKGVKSFLLAGEGEPLLNRHVAEFVRRAKEKGIDGALTSNGVLMTAELSEKLLPHLSWARFSIESPYPEKYAKIHGTNEKDFHAVVKNIKDAVRIKAAQNLDVTIGIQQILINENYMDVYANTELARDLGVDYYTVKRFSKHPMNTYDVPEGLFQKCIEEFQKAESLADDNFNVLIRRNQFEGQRNITYDRCIGLPFITQILANGGVYPCCLFFDDDSKRIGNLYEQSFAQIWQSERKQEVMNFIENNVDVRKCMTYCRHHSTNIFLWQFMELPAHINFI